ncbi:MAG: helix-turn-helix transcriptional regulator [Gammaproteobacteria bacterium]|nr:helix-turn-helix transcriptional regulator [Gammaproteobacteria bacterium]
MNDSERRRRLHSIFDGRPVTGNDRAYALQVCGYSQTELATLLGIRPQSINDALFDRVTSYNIASKLAEITHIPLQRLWPCGRYNSPPRRQRAA